MDISSSISRITFPNDRTVRYYYAGGMRTAVYMRFQIDAEVGEIRRGDASAEHDAEEQGGLYECHHDADPDPGARAGRVRREPIRCPA